MGEGVLLEGSSMLGIRVEKWTDLDCYHFLFYNFFFLLVDRIGQEINSESTKQELNL